MLSEKTMVAVVSGVCGRIRLLWGNGCEYHALILATRLWNVIDRLDKPEPMWAIMLDSVSFAFRDTTNPNSINFTYKGC